MNLELTLGNYDFDLTNGGGWASYFNSIRMATYTAVVDSSIIFFGAYLVEKGRGFTVGRNVFHAIAMTSLAVPGMALGLAYIFFFNNPANPFNFLYGTMEILVLVTITHFYTVSHLTATTALKQDGSGVRVRLRFAEDAFLPNLLQNHRARLCAGYF
jgi:iron(III) transport system permease protein